ncbi:MAG: glycosyltransferase family 2 protein [Cyclobacteriaceae bacterium]|nr:glycosyltransferase family 2 protein [Cyclobacteriaceae bacterium]
MPLVSIYITNYNYDKYLKQAIESVLNQTHKNIELFIIDDGSEDNSKHIMEEYRYTPHVTVIYQQNKGLNATNNVAMNLATGKYFMRLDADDFLDPYAIETMVAAMDADDELGLIFPDYYYIDADGNIIGEERRHDFETDVSLYDQPAHGACTMVRLEFLKKLGGYNEAFTCQDGYELWIKFTLNHKVNNINKPLFYYRRHGNNLTTNEEKILSTRQKIKSNYIQEHSIHLPPTVVIIPVRNTSIGGNNWPMYHWSGKTILEHAIQKACEADTIQWVVVSSADDNIISYVSSLTQYTKLIVVKRPESFARVNESLNKTIDLVLDTLVQHNVQPEAIMTLSLEYPFVASDNLNDAVNTLSLFKSDSLLSVRPDNRMYYQHVGHGMVPILDQDKFTKLEREALYKGAGGIAISTLESYRKNRRLVAGKVGHIVVGSEAAFHINSFFDYTLFSGLNKFNHNNGNIAITDLEQPSEYEN